MLLFQIAIHSHKQLPPIHSQTVLPFYPNLIIPASPSLAVVSCVIRGSPKVERAFVCAFVFLLVCWDIHTDIHAVYLCSFSDFLSTVEMDCPKGYSFKNGVTCVGEWSLLTVYCCRHPLRLLPAVSCCLSVSYSVRADCYLAVCRLCCFLDGSLCRLNATAVWSLHLHVMTVFLRSAIVLFVGRQETLGTERLSIVLNIFITFLVCVTDSLCVCSLEVWSAFGVCFLCFSRRILLSVLWMWTRWVVSLDLRFSFFLLCFKKKNYMMIVVF